MSGDIVWLEAEEDNFEILWDKETARFEMSGYSITTDFDCFYGKELEVIGNIYENPELLKEE